MAFTFTAHPDNAKEAISNYLLVVTILATFNVNIPYIPHYTSVCFRLV